MHNNIRETQGINIFSTQVPRKRLGRAGLLAAAAAAALLLSACNKTPDAASTPAPAAPVAGKKATPEAPASEQATAKLNAYTAAYNKLIGTFGLPETRDRYFKENIPAKTASNNVSISDGWLDQSLESFRKGRALPAGGLGTLDTAADALITPLDKLVTQLKALDIYYTSKAYKEDNLAKGKAQDAEVRGLFEASIAAMNDFNKLLGQEQKKRGDEALVRLKASGDMVAYGTKLALQQGDELIGLFSSEADIKNPEKYKEGDVIVASLEKTLGDQREQYAAAKAKDKNPDSGHDSVNGRMVSLIGQYREMKQSKKPNDFNGMVKSYNSAVESANRISR